MINLTEQEIEKFWSQVDKTGLHWYWMGRTINGYGVFYPKGECLFVHRISFELLVCEIPESKPELDHYCHVRNCLNPDHLLPTTRAGNIRTRRNSTWIRSPYVQGGKEGTKKIIRTICSNNHKVKLLEVQEDGGVKCFHCVQETNERRKQKTLSSLNTHSNIESFMKDYCRKFTKGIAKRAVELKLLQTGIKVQPKRVQQAEMYIERFFDEKKMSLEELANAFNLQPRTTKLFPDKQPDFANVSSVQ